MIEWLERVDPDRPFLREAGRTWTYGQTLDEVTVRVVPEPRLIQPSLSAASVFDVLAGLSGGGATVVGPGSETVSPGDADLVAFTSGSTGPPKGVRFSEANLVAAASASAEHLGHGPEDDWLLAMPLHHVAGLSILIRQMHTGGSITMLPAFEPDGFAEAMRGPVTMVSVVPTMLARLLDRGPFPGLRAVLVGGGPIPHGLLEKAAEAGLPVLPTYGMTETLGQAATLRPGAPLEYKAHPLPGIDLRVEPDRRIAVKGPQVSPGYLGQPDRSDPWFITNDLGQIDTDGALRVLGRTDNVIITGGENVSPDSVEAVLRTHPHVKEAVVVGVADPDWGEMVVCVYEGQADEFHDWALERLPGHAVPKKWLAVERIARTPIGKPDRAAVRALFDKHADGGP